ncbi:hypothetical protein COO60DRAFT_1574972 [Scenedesmus sp. NREL 46B-D3]|nr:hypothetical protein COO60DRAFT_1574972 [Scenedesmus sp. NREL 46B-D3]
MSSLACRGRVPLACLFMLECFFFSFTTHVLYKAARTCATRVCSNIPTVGHMTVHPATPHRSVRGSLPFAGRDDGHMCQRIVPTCRPAPLLSACAPTHRAALWPASSAHHAQRSSDAPVFTTLKKL